jgi:cadmium resistance protein CadD (predicted permease)
VEDALSIAGLAVLAFAATNFDNLLLIVGALSRPRQAFGPVVAGVLLSSSATLALCVAAALAAGFAPEASIGYLGLVPIALGLLELYRLVRSRGAGEGGARPDAPPIPALAVAAVMLANSADSVGALIPLFAETRHSLLPAIVAAVLLTSLCGCALARWIASHEHFGPPIRRVGPVLVPFVLIAVGLYVLSDTRTDTLLDVAPIGVGPVGPP